jgi:hypothetical protein
LGDTNLPAGWVARVTNVYQQINGQWVVLGTHADGQTYTIGVELNSVDVRFALDAEIRDADGRLVADYAVKDNTEISLGRPCFTSTPDHRFGLVDASGAERWWNDGRDEQGQRDAWNWAFQYIWSGCGSSQPEAGAAAPPALPVSGSEAIPPLAGGRGIPPLPGGDDIPPAPVPTGGDIPPPLPARLPRTGAATIDPVAMLLLSSLVLLALGGALARRRRARP